MLMNSPHKSLIKKSGSFSSLMGKPSRSSGFSPASISGLVLWLKADAGTFQTIGGSPATADGDPVGQWLDQSSQANHAAGASDSVRPTLKLSIQNGLPMILGDSVDDYLLLASNLEVTVGTVFAVYKKAVAATNLIIVGSNTSNAAVEDFSDGDYYWVGDGGTYANLDFAATATTALGVWKKSGGAGNYITRKNGSELTGAGNTNTTTFRRVGSRASGPDPWRGYLGEILVYDSALSVPDTSAVEAYLNTRWGVY